MTKKLFLFSVLVVSALTAMAQVVSVSSPNGKLKVDITCQDGQATYTVNYDGQMMMTPSALGLKTDIGDYTKGLRLTGNQQSSVDKTYTMTRTKTASSHFVANQLDVTLTNADDMPMVVRETEGHEQCRHPERGHRFQLPRPGHQFHLSAE